MLAARGLHCVESKNRCFRRVRERAPSDSPHRDEGKESNVQDMVGVVGEGRKSQVVPMIIRPSVIAARRPIPEGV